MNNKTMLTDLYQLTMGAVYQAEGKNDKATFDFFIRKLPTDWGYFVANGIEDAVDAITNIKFETEDLDYLATQGFSQEYMTFLKDMKFEGDVYAVKEGTPVFPNEPIMRVTAPRAQAQLVETALLNIVNYQTMIASKAARVVEAAKDAKVVDFGLRRAQGEDAAMHGARAAYLAGAVATSNVKAGKEYGIPITGTMAHALVMSFPTELEAFRAYARTFPNNPTLLIDTYDTLQGAINSTLINRDLKSDGKALGAVRIDSGDLANLSKKVRKILNESDAGNVKIIASNDLNEYKIADLLATGAPIDGFGVGTEMITAKPTAAIPGVYKLVEDSDGAKIKLSEGKRTLPGIKQVYRQIDNDGKYSGDVIALETEDQTGFGLLELAIKDGTRVRRRPSLNDSRAYSAQEREKLPDYVKALHAGEPYKVTVSDGVSKIIGGLSHKKYSEIKKLAEVA